MEGVRRILKFNIDFQNETNDSEKAQKLKTSESYNSFKNRQNQFKFECQFDCIFSNNVWKFRVFQSTFGIFDFSDFVWQLGK